MDYYNISYNKKNKYCKTCHIYSIENNFYFFYHQ